MSRVSVAAAVVVAAAVGADPGERRRQPGRMPGWMAAAALHQLVAGCRKGRRKERAGNSNRGADAQR